MTYDGLPDGVPDAPPRRSGRGAVRAVRERRRAGAAAGGRSASVVRGAGRIPASRPPDRSRRAALWPADAVTAIGRDQAAERGRHARCASTAMPGWGREVQRGKYVDGRFSARARRRLRAGDPRSLAAAAGARRGSRRCRRPRSAGSSATSPRALAAELGLPYVECLSVRDGAPPQKAMQNSVQQARECPRQARHRRPRGPAGARPAGRRHRGFAAGR